MRYCTQAGRLLLATILGIGAGAAIAGLPAHGRMPGAPVDPGVASTIRGGTQCPSYNLFTCPTGACSWDKVYQLLPGSGYCNVSGDLTCCGPVGGDCAHYWQTVDNCNQ